MTSNDKSLVIFETEMIFYQNFGSKLHHEIASKLVWYDHKLLTHFWKIILQRFLKFVVAYEGLICII